MQKKDKILFIIDDDRDASLSKGFFNSIRKFHSEEDLEIRIIKAPEYSGFEQDRNFYYRAKSIIAYDLMKEGYELIIGCDADQIIFSEISHIWEHSDYDVATVLNINRVDPGMYGFVTTSVLDPSEYYNCGLVAMKSKEFIEKWLDLLNLMCYFGNWKVKCLDRYDAEHGVYAWWGLVAKGETLKAVRTETGVMIPKGTDNYPDHDIDLKILHTAGGSNELKLNYKILFSEEVISYIDWLRSETDKQEA
jgi:hypothetical protein